MSEQKTEAYTWGEGIEVHSIPTDIITKLKQQADDLDSEDSIVYLKLFTPDGAFTWHITEGSPIKDESGKEVDFHFFGLVDGHEKELGYVALSELESVRGPMGLPIERDLWWQPKTLEEIAPELFGSDERTEG